jgi:hypothetical protein
MEDLNPDFNSLPLSNSQVDTLMKDLFDESDGVGEIVRSIPMEQNVKVRTTAVNNIMVQLAPVQSANLPMPEAYTLTIAKMLLLTTTSCKTTSYHKM